MGDAKTMADIINEFYDNSFENMGEKNSFIWYGTFMQLVRSASY